MEDKLLLYSNHIVSKVSHKLVRFGNEVILVRQNCKSLILGALTILGSMTVRGLSHICTQSSSAIPHKPVPMEVILFFCTTR